MTILLQPTEHEHLQQTRCGMSKVSMPRYRAGSDQKLGLHEGSSLSGTKRGLGRVLDARPGRPN